MQLYASARGVCGVRRKGVLENPAQHRGGRIVCIKRKRRAAVKGERAQIIHAENVVGMRMRVEDSINVANVLAQRLLPKVLPGVDDDGVPAPLHRNRWARAGVARINGCADLAIASERGHAHGRAAAEDEYLRLHARRGYFFPCGGRCACWARALVTSRNIILTSNSAFCSRRSSFWVR